MKLARELERRLEAALDGLSGRLFRGGLHSSELAARIAREAELAEFDTVAGPATANRFVLHLHPSNLSANASTELAAQLARVFHEHASDRGWRLQGPVKVSVQNDATIAPGAVRCEAAIVPGPLAPWARLKDAASYDIGPNRALVGRGADCDISIGLPEVSRHHAIIFRQDGQAYLVDLDSVNGTAIDGTRVGRLPMPINSGSILTLAGHELRFTHVSRLTSHASDA